MAYADGARYDGSFKEGRRDGRGTYTFPDGQQYTGKFSCDAIDAAGAGSLLMAKTVALGPDAWMIPLHMASDVGRIHARAGFDRAGM